MSQTKEPTSYDQHLVSLGRVLQTLREGTSIDALVEAVLTYLKADFGSDLIWIGLYDRAAHRLSGKGGTTPLGNDAAVLKQRFTLTSGDVLEQIVIQQRPLSFPDLREEVRANEWGKFAQRWGIQGTMIFPISYQECCFGAAILGSRLWGNFPKTEEKALLSMVLGSLAAALERVETEQRRQQIKQLDEPLLRLLAHLRSLPNLGQRLDIVVDEAHQFIQPTRTSIYWFERQRRYFWRRVTHQKSPTRGLPSAEPALTENQPVSGMTVQEMSSFYQALMADQVVSIGEAMSSLRSDVTSRVMQNIKARSLLAAPILYRNELLGFLAAEGSDARVWQEGEKKFIRGAAQLIALVAPLEDMETMIEQTKLDQALTAEIAHSIYDTSDWKVTLKNAAELLGKRLRTDRFLALLYNPEQGHFEVCYQSHPKNRRALGTRLGTLSPIDWDMLERHQGAIAIENIEEDLRLAAWRETLLELDVRSLLLCNTALGQSVEGLLIVAHETPRAWSQPEGELTQAVARQIGLILRQWQLQQQHEQQQKIYQTIQWGLASMQQTQQLDLLERSALQYIAQVLQAPVAALVSWFPGKRAGRLMQSIESDRRFSCNPVLKVSLETDVLMHRALAHDGIVPLSIDDIPPETRQWLNAPEAGQLLMMALRTAAEHEPSAVLIVVDTLDRQWIDRQIAALTILVSQFAWSRRYLMVSESLKAQRDRLERLSWYKHRRLEDMYRAVKSGVTRLGEMPSSAPEPLMATRQQQILRQIDDAIAPINAVIRDEQWQLTHRTDTVPLISLLRRALDRVDHLIKQRQLWSQVHNDTNPMVTGDIAKIELVLYELLLLACQRSHPGGRIDIWCRPLDARWIEVSITDDGTVEPRLIDDLERGRAVDLLAPSLIDKAPGLHLAICQSLMKQLGGEFNLYKLEDGRLMSRLVLPIG
ncbi:GAF domain-containing protein [Myxacorys almedinensis]|uniref:GAF domain-containing protein n=1 Tax=Myxacorys almedinensis A TaxID=2690445 RepID=A0A8J7Z7M4_9CYAN|nr:GAF domain-containing protein [Myxacorys almedinensis]NDJ19621.1 GAF domain-containing protein [Myxacorys almedinensis A]